MPRRLTLLLAAGLLAAGSPQLSEPLSLCELARNYSAHRGQSVAIRGVYIHGLRQTCPHKCADGPWPSFIDLTGAATTDWSMVERARRRAVEAAKRGIHLEVWVTAIGQLQTQAKHSPLGPCDRIGSNLTGYGHLGAYPAQMEVTRFTDMEIKDVPGSPYDYRDVPPGRAF